MKKLFLILAFLALAASGAKAQQIMTIKVDGSGGGRVDVFGLDGNTKMKKMDDAYLQCIYNAKYVRDTINPQENTGEDILVLMVGPKASKFYSQKTFLADSAINAEMAPGRPIDLTNGSKYEQGETYILYKDREKGELIYTDKISMDHFIYQEKLEPQKWEILDETKEILGYECQKAECDFRGRRYEAWFTRELPISEGPWKFEGLPGLILAVADDQGHYSFEMAGITRVENIPINYADAKYHKTKRKDFLKTKLKYATNPLEYLQNNLGAQITITNVDGTPISGSELHFMKYDFMEKDYK